MPVYIKMKYVLKIKLKKKANTQRYNQIEPQPAGQLCSPALSLRGHFPRPFTETKTQKDPATWPGGEASS